MNCSTLRNAILALPDPRSVPDPLGAHLAACTACRLWAEQVARLETLLERLPVPPPPADKKSALVASLTGQRPAGPFAERFAPSPAPSSSVPSSARWSRSWVRHATLVGALAAAVLLAWGAWVFLPAPGPKSDQAEATPEHSFLKAVARRNVALARTESPREKFQALVGLTDDLSAEAVALARVASPEDLKDIARWFDRVVREGLIRQAERMPEHALTAAERHAEFAALARKLADTAARTEGAAVEVAPEARAALERIRDSARFGEKKLSELARGK